MISFKNISKTYKQKKALNDISFSVEKGERVVLLGGSGSGKTTLLKMVLRLIDPTKGTIFIDDKDYKSFDLITLRRMIGYAIQNKGLFHHMNVYENIAIVLRLIGWKEKAIQNRVEELLTIMGMRPKEFLDKYPSQLSGGQGQRIGVARALAHDPPIVLMDEPFAELDPITRRQLQNECIDLQVKLEKTFLFVTHDVQEAIKMGDRIVMLKEGNLQQLGTPEELVKEPVNAFVSSFFEDQRFLLLLMIKKIDEIPLEKTEPTKFKLGAKMTLLDVMNAFFENKLDTISIFKKEVFLGNVTKEKIVEEILKIIKG